MVYITVTFDDGFFANQPEMYAIYGCYFYVTHPPTELGGDHDSFCCAYYYPEVSYS